MRKTDRLVFDFETNAWVHPDAFNARAKGHEIALDAPDTTPAEGRWNKPRLAKKPTPVSAVFLVWLSTALVVASIVLNSLLPVVLAVLAAILAAVLNESAAGTDLRIGDADQRLLEDPDDPDVCLVLLTIRRDGRRVGTDKGAVWFADGLLLYSGHRTSFAIGGEDVLPRANWSAASLGDHVVPLRLERGSATLELRPLVYGNGGGPQEMRFLKRLYAFRNRPPRSRGPRQWPPLE